MRRMGSLAVIAALMVAALVGTGSMPAFAARVRAVPVARGLDSPVGFTFTPAGRLVYLERSTGWLRFRNLKTGADQRIFRIPNVDSAGERGALGVAVDPRWPDRRFVYVFATRNTSKGLRNQVLRIRIEDGRKVGLRTLLSASAGPASNHNGGRIAFGPDGKLYVVIGDNAVSSNAQDRSANLHGKILRIDRDGSVPAGNPFGTRIWVYGIRNSFGFTWDRSTGRLWETDNGPECNDEVNLIRKGGNHGWGPNQDCSSGSSPTNTNNSGPTPRILPKHTFVSPVGITGAAFCRACGLGAAFNGDLVVGAVNDGVIRRLDLNARRNGFDRGPIVVLDRPGPVLSIEVGPNGRIFFSDFGTIYRLAPA
jgi:glucose/arabinose dehydrogenase